VSDEYKKWVESLVNSTDAVEVIDPDRANAVDVIVCRLATTPLILPDNVVATCSRCFRMIQHRPHVPPAPTKMCDECIRPEIERRRLEGDLKFLISENTAHDLAVYARRRKLH
jgi:predicted RNA methylase